MTGWCAISIGGGGNTYNLNITAPHWIGTMLISNT